MTGAISPVRSSVTVSALQAATTAKIDKRLSRLSDLEKSLQANTSMSSSERQKLEDGLEQQRLNGLENRLGTETSGSGAAAPTAGVSTATTALAAAKADLDGDSDALAALTPQDYKDSMFAKFVAAVKDANTQLGSAQSVLAKL